MHHSAGRIRQCRYTDLQVRKGVTVAVTTLS
jgi:hypothetical protein